ncbi:hypothetical protein [Mycoplana dimorpha]|uniref:Secreted protein n=1 Tax=Mycoplana dimorpha TaxID=28320 RepID=A0A2T5BHK9_MYCDI|nr:hypothetical protein [Mycoplana dimorpha]PTM98363.1 hypothetical protein C7449_10126 [Mycoplana dimorpha]
MMRFPSLVALIGLAFLSSTTAARATGSLGCSIDDGNLRLEVESAVGHGNGAPLLNFRGELALPALIAPKGLEKTTLDRSNLPQNWLHGDELRLLVYVETTGDLPFASAEIVMMTKAREDQITYDGDYLLRLFTAAGDGEVTEKRGKVRCSVG